MHQRVKRAAARLGALALVAGGAAVAVPSAAQAATYNGACGSGYSVIDSLSVTGGTIFLTYSGSTGKNCVVTVRNTSGAKVWMDASVKLSSSSTWHDDANYYSTYAGPVYVYAPGSCIDWYGSIDGYSNAKYNSHCS